MEFTFTVQVMEQDSFLPQDVTTFSDTLSKMKLLNKCDGTLVVLPAGEEDILITKKSSSIADTPAVAEVTTLEVASYAYEKYNMTISGEFYEIDNETDIFSVTPEPTGSAGDPQGTKVGEVTILSSISLVGTVWDTNGYYEMNGNDIVLTAAGSTADASVSGSYDVTVGGNVQTASIVAIPVTVNNRIGDGTTISIADALRVEAAVAPTDITITGDGTAEIIITHTTGGQANVDKSSNIIQTGYVVGSLAEDSVWYDQNGYVIATMTATQTDVLLQTNGDIVDGCYLKSAYSAILDMVFTDTTLNRVARIQDVYVANSGV